MKAPTGELCCGTVTDPTPAKRSVDVSTAGAAVAFHWGTICCSCAPLSYIGCAMTSRGKPLLLQSIWACKDTRAALLEQPRQMLSFGIRCRYSCEGMQVSLACGMLCTALVPQQVPFRPWLLAIHTLWTIKASVNERHQGFDSHVVEAHVL